MIYKLLLLLGMLVAKVSMGFMPSRRIRHKVRDGFKAWAFPLYFKYRYPQFFEESYVPVEKDASLFKSSRTIWQVWFQGRENAPRIVKDCFDSVEKFKGDYEHKILDAEQLSQYIDIPDYIERKYKRGQISIQHYADLVRLELLYQYGGIWIDATCLMTAPIPKAIKDSDFFTLGVSNIFIRAKCRDRMLALWRKALLEFWKTESFAPTYLFVFMLLGQLFSRNPYASERYKEIQKLKPDSLGFLKKLSWKPPKYRVWLRRLELFS